ncbi:hypothetical protein FGU71_00460 [Erythrobacter insulae]|uniref:Uncharacterized protein n=1 Tax=Erythrobacter insulae TaxID=2584124 RepID=A0A547P8M4_9SPHN|nr:hypothetical protein [Erythrobacter insulae]TRD10490.1 hypothetical protein FGU71_00460 [Erythrobacter insulae]
MARLATSFILGYHGCDSTVAARVIAGEMPLLKSDRDWDWLGPGAYFWEADPQRAMEFAEWKQERGEIDNPAVIGAVIDLRECLDLTNRDDIELVAAAYASFHSLNQASDLPLPQNQNAPSDPFENLLLRYLDCAVFRHLHRLIEDTSIEKIDTVRGMFEEGGTAFPGSAIKAKTHTQIAVRTDDCIKGIFYPLSDGALQF